MQRIELLNYENILHIIKNVLQRLMLYFKNIIKLFYLFIILNLFSNYVNIFSNISNIIFLIISLIIFLFINYLNEIKNIFLFLKKNEVIINYLFKIYWVFYLFRLYKKMQFIEVRNLVVITLNLILSLKILRLIFLNMKIINYLLNNLIIFIILLLAFNNKLISLLLMEIILKYFEI